MYFVFFLNLQIKFKFILSIMYIIYMIEIEMKFNFNRLFKNFSFRIAEFTQSSATIFLILNARINQQTKVYLKIAYTFQ